MADPKAALEIFKKQKAEPQRKPSEARKPAEARKPPRRAQHAEPTARKAARK